MRRAVRALAAPFWEKVEKAGVDRFFLERLLRGLLRRWREDRFARVKQGGLHGDARAELARVFVDLDVSTGGRRAEESERIVASWMRGPHPRNLLDDIGDMFAVPLEVVLGGPGQGKSTVGRFLTLIHASILLVTSPVAGIAQPADVQQMEALLAGLSAEGIALPDRLRVPIWLELRELTDALLHDEEGARDALHAMLRWYAANELREATDVGAIENLLREMPWVMVLDGLDEVPPERGRALVRACVADARSRFAGYEGRMIGSSRPQSYDRSVFGDDVTERTLLPMTAERAALYADRFAECLHAEEEGERDLLLRRMRGALANPATAALMTNPLLVTIMATIVLHHGEPSDRRWTLFEQYYETLYRRETERGTYASGTLREHKSIIDAIHMHVGMSLQARSEDAEGVAALMPEDEMRALVRERLLEGFGEDEAAQLTGDILRATEQRLVLLVQAQEGLYGFELRSFQEFMAAWQVVSLRETETGSLLHRMAPLAAWRNVVLFAIGRQYAKNSPMAWEQSVGLCLAMDEDGGTAARLTLPGARLALAVLGDAPYGKASKPREELMAQAITLLSIPPSEVHELLADALHASSLRYLLNALEGAAKDPARQDAAWMTLFALPRSEQAIGFADRQWPAQSEARKGILDAYFHWPLSSTEWASDWIKYQIATNLSLTSPDDATSELVAMAPDERELQIRITDTATSLRLTYGGTTWTVDPTGTPSPGEYAIPTSSPWAIARAVNALRARMSARQLAKTLDALANDWHNRSAWQQVPIPWPLTACLLAAQSANEVRSIARRLRRGELGDAVEWHKIERSLKVARLDKIKALAGSHDPLQMILVGGTMIPFDSTHERLSLAYRATKPVNVQSLRELDEARRTASSPWVARMIAQLIIALVNVTGVDHPKASASSWPTAEEAINLINVAGNEINIHSLSVLLPSPKPSDLASILMGTRTKIVASFHHSDSPTPLAQHLGEALRIAPESHRLQRALVLALESASLRGLVMPTDTIAIGDGPDALILRATSGHTTTEDVPRLARRLVTSDPWALAVLFNLLDTYQHSRPIAVPLLEALCALPDAPLAQRSAAVDELAGRLASAPLGLSSPAAWLAAGLPSPPPMPNHSDLPAPAGARLASLEITNLRAFPQRFEVTAPPPAGDGQWLVFLGENATGKTTLLRAVAMALAASADAAAVPSNLDGPLRRDAGTDGLVTVRTTDGRTFTTTVSGPAGAEQILVDSTPPRPWVVAYGCRRGSAVGGTDMDTAFAAFRDLDNLFDRPRGLLRASGWLKELQRLSRNNGKQSKDIFEAARAALKQILLGVAAIHVENEVQVELDSGRQVPLALLSDGYLTTAGWVVDLMARWLKRNEARKDIGADFCAKMEGVVLLDEIDLHLHPRWQERIIDDVRKLFPKMTFLATTHHPLTLRGARAGEIYVLDDHDGTGQVTAVQRDIPPGTRIDELITGAWFNRPSAIIDADTRQLLDDHQRLILAGARAGSPKRKELERKLRERLGRYADTSLERFAATLVAQHLDADVSEPSAEKREEVRKVVLDKLKRHDAKRK
jgi:hypothetical protein